MDFKLGFLNILRGCSLVYLICLNSYNTLFLYLSLELLELLSGLLSGIFGSEALMATIGDHDGRPRPVPLIGGLRLGLPHHVHALENAAEHDVFAIEPTRNHGGDEELTAVGIGARVGHGKQARDRVLDPEVLIGERLAVDGIAAGAVAFSEVAALQHELLNDSMEGGAFVALTFRPRAQLGEVGRRLGHDVAEEAKGDGARGFAPDRDIEFDLISHRGGHRINGRLTLWPLSLNSRSLRSSLTFEELRLGDGDGRDRQQDKDETHFLYSSESLDRLKCVR